jgi:succinate dehydrogenase / fumarate reductase cytochrome b subunit|tara:strand:+ start:563 stop:967 length:405 start_codon:yes stop_codon:yes gene_type:complete
MTFVTFLMTQNRPVNINLLKIKLPLSAFLSITHRVSGILIFFLVLPLSVMVFSELTHSQDSFDNFMHSYNSNLGIKLGCIGLMLIFQYHIFTGIRHMLMDFHILNESLSSSFKSAVVTLILFVVNTLLTFWVMI